MGSVLFFAGSARKESYTRTLAKILCEKALHKGIKAELVELGDYPMPLYDGDDEAESGLPANAIALKERFVAASGFVIVAPEYNSSFTPLLKNTIDWISRPHQANEGSLIAYMGKFAGLVGSSPGKLGGLRGLVPLRMLLGNIGVTVIPNQVAVGNIHAILNDTKQEITDPAIAGQLDLFLSQIHQMEMIKNNFK